MTERRAALTARQAALEREVDAYLSDANPSMLELFRVVRNHVRDVRTLYLDAKLATPERSEQMWLTHAERFLDITQATFNTMRAQVDEYGGPSKAQTF